MHPIAVCRCIDRKCLNDVLVPYVAALAVQTIWIKCCSVFFRSLENSFNRPGSWRKRPWHPWPNDAGCAQRTQSSREGWLTQLCSKGLKNCEKVPFVHLWEHSISVRAKKVLGFKLNSCLPCQGAISLASRGSRTVLFRASFDPAIFDQKTSNHKPSMIS